MANAGLRTILCGLLLAPAGCYAHHRAARDRGASEPIPASVWNLEITDELRELEAMTPDVVYRYAIDESVPENERSADVDELAARGVKRVTHTEIRSGGLLRLYEDADSPDSFEDRYGFRPNGSFITARRLTRARVESPIDDRSARYRDTWLLQEHQGLRKADPTAEDLLLDEEGLLLGVPAPAPEARGIVLHLPALFGNEYETRVLEHLEHRGWAIAHVDTEAWIAGPNHLERERVHAARAERLTELFNAMLGTPSVDDPSSLARDIWDKANQQAQAEFPLPETGFEVREGDDMDAVAAVMAEAVDHHLVAHASAAAALVGYLDEHRPDLSGKPVVVVGFSAGALVAPTVAARLGDRVSAVVMIGGGASLFDVARTSTLGHGGINVVPLSGPAPPEHLLDGIGERYRLRAQVDPYRAARALRAIPILHIYGRSDEVIPTFTAETLRAQLGEPDRLVFSGGHRALFYFLPGQRGFIAKWIDDAVRDVDASPTRSR